MKHQSSKLPFYRYLTVIILLLVTAFFLYNFEGAKSISLDQPLANFPKNIGKWKSGRDVNLQTNVKEKLKVDDYINRYYYSPNGKSLSFYVSYFSYTDKMLLQKVVL